MATAIDEHAALREADRLLSLAGAQPGQLETCIVRGDLRTLKLLEKNARYMKAPTFNQLVENVKRDGVLTSVPLVYAGEVLSGNHRVQAALKASVFFGFWLEVVGVLGEEGKARLLERERQVSIQLSHNALVGEDDPSILAELYLPLPLDEKQYSGLTDDALKAGDPLDIASLSAGAMAYQELQLLFLPADEAVFRSALERIRKRTGKAAKTDVLVADIATFDRMFDAIVTVKEQRNVHNTALALRVMAELALERLAELERNGSAESGDDTTGAAGSAGTTSGQGEVR